MVLWMLGYPEGALADADRAIRDAREIGQAASLMAALTLTSLSQIHCGNYAIANAQLGEVITLSNEKGAVFWKVSEMLVQGCLFATTGKASDARPRDYFRTELMACHGDYGVDSYVLVIFDESVCGNRPIR